MRNAMQVLMEAIKLEASGDMYISNFSFVYEGIEIQYYGHYYGYAFHVGMSDEYDFAGNDFESMLNCHIPPWFPSNWTDKDIKRAGSHVAGLKGNRHVSDGVIVYGTYKGVRVGIIRTYGKIATVFPDSDQTSVLNRRRKRI